jgi:YggT family protein
MSASDAFTTHWWFHLPNLAMAALIYTLIGRYVLELVFRGREVVILSVFRSVTDPIVRLVRAITPAVVPSGLVIVFAVVWLMAGRMLWFLTAVAFGMRASAGV